MRKERKHCRAEEKVAILRRHLLDKVPVSDLYEELGLQPTAFYRWQKEFFENGAAAFQSRERPGRQAEERQKRIELLEKKVHSKDEVLAELMAEHMARMSPKDADAQGADRRKGKVRGVEVSRSAPEGNSQHVEKGNLGEGGNAHQSPMADAAT